MAYAAAPLITCKLQTARRLKGIRVPRFRCRSGWP